MRNKSIVRKSVVGLLKVGVVVFGFVLPLWLLACVVYPDCIIPWYLSVVLIVMSVIASHLCIKKMNQIELYEKKRHTMCRRYASSENQNSTKVC